MNREWKRSFYYKLLESFPFEPTQGQKLALQGLTIYCGDGKKDAIFLLKGFAGTGKTTLIKSLVQSLPHFQRSAVLMAPTGRAAKVMGNYSNKRAFTIHKFIYHLQTDRLGRMVFRLRPNKARDCLFIVDEASMINDQLGEYNSSLLSDLMEFVSYGKNCQLLLVGDTAQLPPIHSDKSPALDADHLLRHYSFEASEVELQEVMRQEENSVLLFNATRLRETQTQWPYPQPVFQLGPDVLRLQNGGEVEDALNEAISQVGREEMAIITRSNKRANLYNQQLRMRVLWQEDEVSVGDYLMVVKNNYTVLPENHQASFIANGDILELLEIYEYIELYNRRFARVKLRFSDVEADPFESLIFLEVLNLEGASLSWDEQKAFAEVVAEDYADLPTKAERMLALKNNPFLNALQVKFAYALTCHKAQGGQWKRVFVDHPWRPADEPLDLDYLRWLYTAFTRASDRVYLLGFPDEYFT
jgi:exodeoxyribonuclease-5